MRARGRAADFARLALALRAERGFELEARRLPALELALDDRRLTLDARLALADREATCALRATFLRLFFAAGARFCALPLAARDDASPMALRFFLVDFLARRPEGPALSFRAEGARFTLLDALRFLFRPYEPVRVGMVFSLLDAASRWLTALLLRANAALRSPRS